MAAIWPVVEFSEEYMGFNIFLKEAHNLCERKLTPGVYLWMYALNAGVCIDDSIVVY